MGPLTNTVLLVRSKNIVCAKRYAQITYKCIFIHLIKKMQFPVLYIHNYINAQRQT